MKKRNRRSYNEIFLQRLEELSGGKHRLFGNKRLRASLNWDQRRYDRIKFELLRDARIVVGRGKGGSVGLSNSSSNSALTVFVAYSHVDEQLKNELLKHLEPLKKLGLIDAWHDQRLKAGDEWDKSISKHLESANIVLLLVSIDFINSNYCYDIEFAQALALHQAGDATVIPVVLRACLWQESPLGKFQAVPKDGKAVSSWNDRDEALMSVAESIKHVADHLLQKK